VTVDEARAQFPVLERVAYLNAGSMGPLARPTVEAMTAQDRRDLEEGRAGLAYYETMRRLREQVRAGLAAVVSVDPASVALTASTTNGCNIVLEGLELGPDDEVVTTDVEHFGLIGPLHVSPARIRVAQIRDLPPEAALEAILAEVGPKTRLLALSHVSWLTGHVLPIAELKETTGLPLLVDGAQSAGAIAVDARGYDYYTISAQKWLCGPDATGGLVVADPESLRIAAPTYFSQASYQPDGTFEPVPGAARFDSGWIASPALAGLEAALALVPEWGYEQALRMAARCRELLAERYEIVTAPAQATLVAFRWDGGDPAVASTALHERGVVIRHMPGTEWLRVSCGWWTSEADLEQLLAGLAAVA
jgi:L-cysteine/cystine lyase